MNSKFNTLSLGELKGKTIIVIKSEDYYIGKNGPTYSYSFYNMFYGSNTVSGAYITAQEKILRENGHKTVSFPIEATKMSRTLLEKINTNALVHVFVDAKGNWHETSK